MKDALLQTSSRAFCLVWSGLSIAIVCELETHERVLLLEIDASYRAPPVEARWRLGCGPLLDSQLAQSFVLPGNQVIGPGDGAPPAKAVLHLTRRTYLRPYSRIPQTEPISRDAHIFFLSLRPTHTRLSWQPKIKGARRALLEWPKGSRRLPQVQATKALSISPFFQFILL